MWGPDSPLLLHKLKTGTGPVSHKKDPKQNNGWAFCSGTLFSKGDKKSCFAPASSFLASSSSPECNTCSEQGLLLDKASILLATQAALLLPKVGREAYGLVTTQNNQAHGLVKTPNHQVYGLVKTPQKTKPMG